jgi:hypothetical protein
MCQHVCYEQLGELMAAAAMEHVSSTAVDSASKVVLCQHVHIGSLAS